MRDRLLVLVLSLLFIVDARAATSTMLGFDATELHTVIRPQDDFFEYVNGRWTAATEIPPEWASYGSAEIVRETGEEQVRELIEAASPAQGERSANAKRLGDLYSSFMDEAAVERVGVAPLAQELARIDALATHDEVVRYFAHAIRVGVEVPINFFIEVDGKDPTRNLPYFWQDGLGVPDRDYYLKETEPFTGIRTAYMAHIERICGLAGIADGAKTAQAVVGIEARLARAQWSATANRDRERIYTNQFDLERALSHSPHFDWQAVLEEGAFPVQGKFVLAQDDYFAGLGDLVREVPVADWQAYLRFKSAKAVAPFLPAAVVTENFDFESRTLRGQQEQRPRWKRGVALANQSLGEIVGEAYVARHFAPASKQRIEVMVENLQRAFGKSIDALTWMSEATKVAARDKLAKFTAKIGYPDTWRDYSDLVVRPNDLVGNVLRSREFNHLFAVSKLSKPVDRSEWDMTPQTVNAYYSPTFNEVVFPAAILQPPYFNPAADEAVNYGAIGSVIGHEFSHGFDDQGRKFDGDGRLCDWWTETDAAEYVARSKKLVAQYDAFRPLPDQALNGSLTLGENIGDLAGVIMAYHAYRGSLGGKEPAVVDGFTGDQRFFIGYALAWRGKLRTEFLRELMLSDPHAPNRFRVIGVLRNVPEFYSAFAVKEGDGMYLAPDERVKIW